MVYLTKDEITNINNSKQGKSFAPYIRAINEKVFCGNSVRFATLQECEEYLVYKKGSWFLVEDTMPLISEDEPNYQYTDGSLISLGEEA
jgi:hypothetical protein